MIPALFFLATLIVVAFLIIRLAFPTIDSSYKPVLKNSMVKKELNPGKILLAVGPILAGLGLLGLIARYWDGADIALKLTLVLIFLITFLGTGVYLHFYKKNSVTQIIAEALLILSGFCWGAAIVILAELLAKNLGYSVLGVSEILGLWALGFVPLLYITRSLTIIAIQGLVHIIWLFTYLGDNFNFSQAFGIELLSGDLLVHNRIIYFLLILIQSLLFIALYRRYETEDRGLKNNRVLLYSTGCLAFLTVGAGIWRGVVENVGFFSSVNSTIIAALITVGVTLIMFSLDQIGKNYPKVYNPHWLVFAVVLLGGLVGFLPIFQSYFAGMYFLQTAFSLWLLVDFLREKSYVAQALFYVFNATQLIALTIAQDQFSLFQLVLLLAILVYAMSIHLEIKAFVYYVWVCVITTFLLKAIINRLDFFWVIFIFGLITMALGIYFVTISQKVKETQQDNTEEKKV